MSVREAASRIGARLERVQMEREGAIVVSADEIAEVVLTALADEYGCDCFDNLTGVPDSDRCESCRE